MPKQKKLFLIIGVSLLSAAIIIGTAITVFFIYANQLRFDYTDGVMHGGGFTGTVGDADSASNYYSELEKSGYYQKFPVFTSNTSIGDSKFFEVYSMINDSFKPYLYEMGAKYDNFVQMDYSVSFDKDRSNKYTLTVSFTGFGYPDEGKGEPIKLDRDFVYDITNVNENSMPILLT